MNQTVLNTHCQPYPNQFATSFKDEEIKKNGFAVPKNRHTEKMNRNSPWRQDGSRCPVIDFAELPEVTDKIKNLTPHQMTFYNSPKGIIALNKKGISLAVERRVALFFQQCILCYKMSSFTFSIAGADGQIGSSSPLKIGNKEHKREAAHSSTLPSIIAHAKDGSTPNGFIYLKGGSYYAQHNATIGMHDCVNGADELIDGKAAEKKLRHKTITLLNRVAQGLDPVKATAKFIDAFKSQVFETGQTLTKQDPRKHVLKKYGSKIHKIQLASTEKGFYDGLIGVTIDANHPKEAILRTEVYQKRYDIIQLQEIIESSIGKQIDEAKTIIDKLKKGEGCLLEYILLKAFSEDFNRKTLEKLFCKTAAIFENDYIQKAGLNRSQKTQYARFQTRISNLQEKHKKLIFDLQRKLRENFRTLTCAEYSFRAGIFKTLRTRVNKWTQAEFCEEYLQVTGKSISRSWVSRMEQLSRSLVKPETEYKTNINQRRRYITLKDAIACARTFDVDAGIFLPSLFTSNN